MTSASFLATTLAPGLSFLTATVGPTPPDTDAARLLLLAIAGQESGWQNIPQGGGGPGRGPWQFEPETCKELMFNPESAAFYTKICMALSIVPSRTYDGLLAHPNLAVSLARLDLWCNPNPLPEVGDQEAAWEYYLETWRPGSPGPDRWPANYQAAMAAMKLTGEQT